MVPFGRPPKFSPDGKWIAYRTGEEHHFEGKTFIVPSAGGKPMRVGADLPDAKWPVWSSDGKSLLVYGSRETPRAGGAISGPTDEFLIPIDGKHPRETGWPPLCGVRIFGQRDRSRGRAPLCSSQPFLPHLLHHEIIEAAGNRSFPPDGGRTGFEGVLINLFAARQWFEIGLCVRLLSRDPGPGFHAPLSFGPAIIIRN